MTSPNANSPDWRKPGGPRTIEVNGKKITLKGATVDDKLALAKQVTDLKGTDESALKRIYQIVADQIETIEGVDGDVLEFLQWQHSALVMEIWGEILEMMRLPIGTERNLG